jgi:hypothetical protein
MVAAGAYTPREKTFLPFFSATTEVDPILWTKKGHSLATLLPAFLTGNL